MAEAEAVLTGELWPVGADQLAPHERRQPWRHLRLLGCQCLHGAAVEDLALDRAALEHPPLGRVELVEPRRQQRLQRRRHLDLASPASWAIASISLMKSGLPAAAAAILARSSSGTSVPIRLGRVARRRAARAGS